jgi:hypothetical protein
MDDNIAFLFLTYDNFTNQNIMKKFLINSNIYIHPKYPNNVNTYFKKYIINNLINTEWSKYSIVLATINLLKEAFNNINNKWFVLLSQDCFPVYNYNKFKCLLNKFNKSLFYYHNNINKYWKTSQWWILIRHDVEIILNNHNINDSLFKDIKINNAAIDEIYFLSVLNWNNPNYKFINYKIMYDKWLTNTIQKSPQYFNYLLNTDLLYIKKYKCFFIRKITEIFTLTKYKIKKKLFIIYIGTETDQNNIIINNKFDIILIISIDYNLIKKNIINSAIYIINIIYKFYYETITAICNEEYIKNWNIIIFTTEKFNLNNYNNVDKNKKELLNTGLKFYYIKDNNNNLAFCYKK